MLDYDCISAWPLKLLRWVALLVFVVLLVLLADEGTQSRELLAPFGVIVAALLATFSVTYGIETQSKREQAIRKRTDEGIILFCFNQVCHLKLYLLTLEREKQKERITFNDFSRIKHQLASFHKVTAKINEPGYLSILPTETVQDFFFLHLELESMSLYLEKLDIRMPDYDHQTKPILPNFLNAVTIRFDKLIFKAESVLLSLAREHDELLKRARLYDCQDYFIGINRKQDNDQYKRPANQTG